MDFFRDTGIVLAEAYRDNFPENYFTGWLVISDTNGNLLYSTSGAQQISTFFRSSAKPFQVMPLVFSGLHHNLACEELAVACASHTGSEHHLTWVRSLLAKTGYLEEMLGCGPHEPLDPEMANRLCAMNQPPQPIHNNCSGKHAGMLYYCSRLGADAGGYLAFDHPLQLAILEVLKSWSESPDIPRAVDGCGAPVFYLPLQKMALCYARLGVEDAARPIVEAMTEHPDLVGGVSRIDSELMKVTKGRLLCKVGADGVMAVSLVGRGLGLALKIADGSTDIRNLYIVWALHQLGWLTDSEWLHPALSPFRNTLRRNTQGQVVGAFRFYLP